MFNNPKQHKVKRALLVSALLASAVALAGCQSDMNMADDEYKPVSSIERYPIKVAKVPMKLEVAPHKGGLQAQQISAIRNFARSASLAGVAQVTISRPSGGGASASVANEINALLLDNNVPSARISHSTYRGSARAPVIIAFTRAVAVTKECGDWSRDMAYVGNGSHPNFGCATQNNIAAMMNNPNDVKVMRPFDPAWSSTRYNIKDLLKD